MSTPVGKPSVGQEGSEPPPDAATEGWRGELGIPLLVSRRGMGGALGGETASGNHRASFRRRREPTVVGGDGSDDFADDDAAGSLSSGAAAVAPPATSDEATAVALAAAAATEVPASLPRAEARRNEALAV